MWLIVMSNYQELADITRLEDMAKLKVLLAFANGYFLFTK